MTTKCTSESGSESEYFIYPRGEIVFIPDAPCKVGEKYEWKQELKKKILNRKIDNTMKWNIRYTIKWYNKVDNLEIYTIYSEIVSVIDEMRMNNYSLFSFYKYIPPNDSQTDEKKSK